MKYISSKFLRHKCWLFSFHKAYITNTFTIKHFTGCFQTVSTGWKVSIFGVILVRIFPHSDCVWRDTPCSVWMRKYTDHNNYEYGHVLGSVVILANFHYIDILKYQEFWKVCHCNTPAKIWKNLVISNK